MRFWYWNRPERRCASILGSVRACACAIWMRVGEGSIAVTDAAVVFVFVLVFVLVLKGIVLAIDSAKIPPPQPTSKYFKPPSDGCGGGACARQVARKSWRIGFIRCRTRDGPIGSHQLLARDEKCDNSFADTDEVEWLREVVVLRTVARVLAVGRRGGIFFFFSVC